MDELFEALTLIQTRKIARFPIVLVGRSYWQGLIDWLHQVMEVEEKNISPGDIGIMNIVDTADEAVEVIDRFYSKYLMKPNF